MENTIAPNFDLLVIGAGPGGYVAALKAAQLGMKVAVAEARELGGTCLNRGCIPTKTLLHSAELFRQTRELAEFGIAAENVVFDYAKIFARKEEISAKLRDAIARLFSTAKITLLRGNAKILDGETVLVGEEKFSAKNILVAAGSEPAMPPIPGIDLPGVMTSDGLLARSETPFPRLLIIGGGVIGCEFASIYSALGCEVVIVEALDRILANMDREIAQSLAMNLKQSGVKIFASARVEKIERENASTAALSVSFSQKNGEVQNVSADGVLVAVGRRPNTRGLFENGFSVENDRGAILVDENFRTSVPTIFAIGDATKTIQLAHVASAQGKAVAEIIAGKTPGVNFSAVPACVYTEPEIASVGLTADEAKARGIPVKTGKCVMSANAKSLIDSQKRGFMKLVFHAETEVLLGAQLMCGRATDIVGELSVAIANGLTRDQLASVIRAHPTFEESIDAAL